MMRLSILVAATFAFAGCSKPSTESCRKAIANMQQLMGTENLNSAGIEGEVRRCKGGSKKKAVECAIKATTLDELRHCDFYKVPANATGIGDSGPGSAGSGSAGSGSASGSATGSGSPDSGSATGSGSTDSGAATGSAATGPAKGSGADAATAAAKGSAAGSAAPVGSAQ